MDKKTITTLRTLIDIAEHAVERLAEGVKCDPDPHNTAVLREWEKQIEAARELLNKSRQPRRTHPR